MTNNSLTFNGTDLGGSSYNLRVMNSDYGTPGIEMDSYPIGSGNGSIVGASRFSPADKPLDVYIYGSSVYDLHDKMDAVDGILNELEEDKALKIDLFTDRFWNARLAALPQWEHVGMFAQGSIEFVCNDPLAYSNATDDQDYAITGPQTFTCTTGGSANTAPIIIFEADSTESNFTFENTDRGERIQWTGSLESGNFLKIDCGTKRCYWKVNAGGTYALSMDDVKGVFPLLNKNSVNNMEVLNPASGDVNVEWYNRFVR